MFQRVMNIINVIIFFGIVVSLLLNINLKTNQISNIDNKMLYEFKGVDNVGAFTDGVEQYLSDRIGARNQFIVYYITIHDKLFNTMLHPHYIKGKDGHLFGKYEKTVVDVNYMDSLLAFVEKMQVYSVDRGIDFRFCINPNKAAVYSEYWPEGLRYEVPRLKYLQDKLRTSNINYIDWNDVMIDLKKTGVSSFNKHTDIGHWNDVGRFEGISYLFDNLSEHYPKLSRLNENGFLIKNATTDYLYQTQLPMKEELLGYLPKAFDYEEIDISDELMTDDYYHYHKYYINKNNPTGPKILYFAGSFMLNYESFLQNEFSEIIVLTNYWNIHNLAYYCNIFEPDIVVFEIAEHVAVEAYFPLYNFLYTWLNPVFDINYFNSHFKLVNYTSVSFEPITNLVKNSIRESLFLSKFIVDINRDDVFFAYLKVDDKYYDFLFNSDQIRSDQIRSDQMSITLKTSILESANKITVILISPDGKMQEVVVK